MRRLLLACLMPLAAACAREPAAPMPPPNGSTPQPPSEPLPPIELVDRIESQLAGRPCIGALADWERNFSYGHGGDQRRERGIERDRVVFVFREAGMYQYRSQRIIGSPEMLDERQMKVAVGEYDLLSGRLTVDACGLNNRPDPPEFR